MSYVTDRLIKNALVALPGSLDDAIRLELFNVLDQFFRDSSVWSENIDFSVTANDPAGTIYYIEPESSSIIVRLFYVVDQQNGFRQRALMAIPGEVTLTTPPGQTGTMTATVALSVVDPVQKDGYPSFPEWILQKYGQGILDGVLGRMMLQPAKPYTDVRLGAAHLVAFRRTISIAGTESLRGNVMNSQAWYYPQQFATRSRRGGR